jgi:signal transduction histidine kinase
MYGERDEPYAILARLGQRLEGSITPEAVLPTIATTVREALRLPYAAIALRQGDGFVTAAAVGVPSGVLVHVPLVYQREAIGELILAPRSAGEAFGPRDERLLADLARHIGVAAHNVHLNEQTLLLNADLQRSREQLVTTREEERRRLRRDLHDGLGPSLASMALQAEVARDLVPSDPREATMILNELSTQLQSATSEIRRLVYALRPPALDDLGLAGALRSYVARYEHGPVAIVLVIQEPLPPLPAAVEVAAYRIATEAVTNVVRHAKASNCTVRLSVTTDLALDVVDDGIGIPTTIRPGVGFTSMRERTSELGGRIVIESGTSGGTRILAKIPLDSDHVVTETL